MTTILKCLFGSHLYGTNTENSDTDYKSVFLPPIEDLILQKNTNTISTSTGNGNSKNSANDVDNEYFSLHKYLKMLLEGQAVAMDMFFAPDSMIIEKTEHWDIIRSYKEHFISRNIKPYIGYAYQQASKYGIKGSRVSASRKFLELLKDFNDNHPLEYYWYILEKFVDDTEHCEITFIPTRQSEGEWVFDCCGKKYQKTLKVKYAINTTQKLVDNYGSRALMAERNEGIDFKALHHAVRITEEAIELLTTGNIEFPLKNREFLTKIKKGEFHYNYVAGIIEERFMQLQEAENLSTLPELPNYEEKNKLILSFYALQV
jgi:hypothetical protein